MNLRCVRSKSLAKLKELSGFVDEDREHAARPALTPWVGAERRSRTRAARTSTPCRAHQRRSYEHIDARRSSATTRNVCLSAIIVGPQRTSCIKAQELGFKLTNDTPELKAHLESRQGTGKSQGYEYEAAEAFARVAHRQGA
jgi:hypothetical protein